MSRSFHAIIGVAQSAASLTLDSSPSLTGVTSACDPSPKSRQLQLQHQARAIPACANIGLNPQPSPRPTPAASPAHAPQAAIPARGNLGPDSYSSCQPKRATPAPPLAGPA
ncbi:hypothetical protein TIFTF001_052566 [Ficus carica]|uniref:Uncharacterized protein n=1 Tax=Ficus carica TaxID=3494 RepID=A0AA88DP57_FICCA|nr:hypothetical protein TIFTF001_027944 [Ficus carica]GMN75113.1 hypothetical protein TIFTF001_052566 [Ficus carica]